MLAALLAASSLSLLFPGSPPVRRVSSVALPLRRELLTAAALAALAGGPQQASAKSGVPSEAELSNLAKGYSRLQYLLANWEKLTTVCIKGCTGSAEQCGCIRDPIIVQSYMGFKSMNDPLFKADQIMIRAQPLVPEDKDFDEYTNAIDRWTRKCDAANVMAYTSSWGEANPGGGKSEVERYLAKSRAEVVESAEILKTIIDILGIPEAKADGMMATGFDRMEGNQRR